MEKKKSLERISLLILIHNFSISTHTVPQITWTPFWLCHTVDYVSEPPDRRGRMMRFMPVEPRNTPFIVLCWAPVGFVRISVHFVCVSAAKDWNGTTQKRTGCEEPKLTKSSLVWFSPQPTHIHQSLPVHRTLTYLLTPSHVAVDNSIS